MTCSWRTLFDSSGCNEKQNDKLCQPGDTPAVEKVHFSPTILPNAMSIRSNSSYIGQSFAGFVTKSPVELTPSRAYGPPQPCFGVASCEACPVREACCPRAPLVAALRQIVVVRSRKRLPRHFCHIFLSLSCRVSWVNPRLCQGPARVPMGLCVHCNITCC